MERRRRRRTVLRLCGAAAVGAGLAGCLGDDEDYDWAVTSPADADAAVTVYWFWGDGCPVCAEQEEFVRELADGPETDVVAMEVYEDDENRALFLDVVEEYGVPQEAVPTTVVGDEFWVGDSGEVREEISDRVADCREESGCQPLVDG